MRYGIYSADGGTLRCEVSKLEYNGQFMGDCYLTVSVKTYRRIAFAVGDYITYRGENFTLTNVPTEKKSGHKNANGDVYEYDTIKFDSYVSELSNADFNDFVGDSSTDISFTAQPNFSFLAADISDLAQRIQINMNRYYYMDTTQIVNGANVSVRENLWTVNVDGSYSTPDNFANMLITVSNITCWDALAYVNSKYGTNFIIRGRTITIGITGSSNSYLSDIPFKVGKYNGLYDMTRNVVADQNIVSRLKSYGNTTNLHPRYYSLVSVSQVAVIPSSVEYFVSSDGTKARMFFLFDLTRNTNLKDCVTLNVVNGSTTKSVVCNYMTMYASSTLSRHNNTLVYSDTQGTGLESQTGYVYEDTVANVEALYDCMTSTAGSTVVNPYVTEVGDITPTSTFYFSLTSGVRKETVADTSKLSFDANSALPNNMNIANLMLPGFPVKTLAQWVADNKTKYTWLQSYVDAGYAFSTERLYPYINSPSISETGIRPHTEYFTSEDNTHKDIHPSLQYFSDDRNKIVACKTIDDGDITDRGIIVDGEAVPKIHITIPYLDFDFKDVKAGDTFTLHMNSGYCGGRDYSITAETYNETTSQWTLTAERVSDNATGKYYPNVDAPINAGDKFVITDIYMPDSYIEQASVELLKWSLSWLSSNDYSVFSYGLSPDAIFIKRHDDGVSDKTHTFHYLVKEGDYLTISDSDMSISGKITIDSLKITEGDGLLPKYDVTLKDTKTVGTIQKIQQQIDSLNNGDVVFTYGKAQVTSLTSLLSSYFLSKRNDDSTDYGLTLAWLSVKRNLAANGGLTIGNGTQSVALTVDTNGYLCINGNVYATGGVAAYGASGGSGSGGGSGITDAVFWSMLGGDETTKQIALSHLTTALASYETAITVNTSGDGNAITAIGKTGTVITATKGATFSLSGHTHAFSALTDKPTTLSGYGITDAYTQAAADERYLKLTGGAMSNQSLVTNLNADMLDGLHGTDLYTGRSAIYYNTGVDINALGIGYYKVLSNAYGKTGSTANTNEPFASNSCYMYANVGAFQLAKNTDDSEIKIRMWWQNERFYPWRSLAYLNSNVDSANKLHTARTIWGQSFDGSGNVSGAMSGVTTLNATGLVTLGTGIQFGNGMRLGMFGDAYYSPNDLYLINSNAEYYLRLMADTSEEPSIAEVDGWVPKGVCVGNSWASIYTLKAHTLTMYGAVTWNNGTFYDEDSGEDVPINIPISAFGTGMIENEKGLLIGGSLTVSGLTILTGGVTMNAAASVAGMLTARNGITIGNGTRSVALTVDSNGYLVVGGNLKATGGVTAYGT